MNTYVYKISIFFIKVGIVGVAMIAALTDYCCGLLIYCKYIVIDRAIDEERDKGHMTEEQLGSLRQTLGKTVGYGDISRRAFGVWSFMFNKQKQTNNPKKEQQICIKVAVTNNLICWMYNFLLLFIENCVFYSNGVKEFFSRMKQ